MRDVVIVWVVLTNIDRLEKFVQRFQIACHFNHLCESGAAGASAAIELFTSKTPSILAIGREICQGKQASSSGTG